MVEVGKTEVVYNNLNPNWTTIFIVEHDEGQAWTPLKIALYDSQSFAGKSSKINRQNFSDSMAIPNNPLQTPSLYKSTDPMMGQVNVEVGGILGMEGQESKLELDEGGCIYVHITESMDTQSACPTRDLSTGEFHCHIRGLDLENIEKGILGLGAIDPYFELSRKYTDHQHGITRWICVYRSEHVPNIINPYWNPFRIDLEKLCHGNISKELKIAVWDHESGRDRWVGECEVNVEWLQKSVTKGGNASREDAISLLNEGQEEIGLLCVLKADIISV